MDPSTLAKKNPHELLEAQAHIWNHIFAYHNSLALKCALELGIPDTIHKHGHPMTLETLATSLSIPPTKTPSLYRLLRLLFHSNFLSRTNLVVNGEETDVYDININSKLLVTDHSCTMSPFTLGMLDPNMTGPTHYLSKWFQSQDESVFHVIHGHSLWDHASLTPRLNRLFNQAMSSDSGLVSTVLLASEHFKEMVHGLRSLVDVGGGDGSLAKAIARACPWLKCIVLDLPHVVEGLQENVNVSNLEFVAGDMFKVVPSADAVMLKSIMHDWSDEDCIRILKRCKEAIPSNGKIIIIDIVVVDPQAQGGDDTHDNNVKNKDNYNTQLLFDMEMMTLTLGGIERNEQEWKQLFIKAGFNHYNISPILGIRSLIEVSCL